ncbi:MAG: hypothetical protein V1871_09740 [Planctomycetota bacterium]
MLRKNQVLIILLFMFIVLGFVKCKNQWIKKDEADKIDYEDKLNSKGISFGSPTFVVDFNNPTYVISDRNLYADDMVTLKENVEVKDNKLLLHCRYENREFNNWWGKAKKTWSIGSVDFKNNAYSYGIWSIKCKLPNDKDGWPAIWLLRERHAEAATKVNLGLGKNQNSRTICVPNPINKPVDLNWFVWCEDKTIGYIEGIDKINGLITVDRDIILVDGKRIFVSPDHITPEVDIMEVIHGRLQHTVHYGYSNTEYRTTAWNSKLGKPDFSKEYEFAVEISSDGYKFYVNGILTGVLTDKKSISEAPCYLILNNAKNKGVVSGADSVFEISEIKFYKR